MAKKRQTVSCLKVRKRGECGFQRKREKESRKLSAASYQIVTTRDLYIVKPKKKNFKHLLVWQKGFQLAVRSFYLVETFPKEERFSLSIQITRAAVSIPPNTAGGSSRASEKDYHRFLQILFGFSYEPETQWFIAEAVKYGHKGIRTETIHHVHEERKMLIGFMGKLAK